MTRLLLLVAAATLSTAIALLTPSGGRASVACGFSGYSYAGVLSTQPRFGVSAAIKPMGAPTVRGGHVAAWVGVGGEGLGPGGTDEWLQAGISAKPGTGSALYYEVALPGRAPRYVMLKGHLQTGRGYRIAVIESKLHPGAWRVWVDGARMTQPIYLPGSHGAWRPVATTESWDGGVGACNSFAFSFSNVSVAASPGGAWSPMEAHVLGAPGFKVARRGLASFVARGGGQAALH